MLQHATRRPAPKDSGELRPAAHRAPSPRATLASGDILQLQRVLGNRHVGVLLGRRGAATPPVRQLQRSCSGPGIPPNGRMCDACAGTAKATVTRALAGSGRPLEPWVLAPLERAFGRDLSAVRVHTDPLAAASAGALGAHAYTVGRDIVFSTGAYSPDRPAGRLTLAHEVAHYLQQGAPRAPVRLDGAIGDAHHPMEREADAAATLVTGGFTAAIRGAARPGRLQGVFTTEPAGGCGICYGQANFAGIAAHTAVQTEFELLHPLGLVEFPVRAPGDENGRLDLALATPTGLRIGEIKPGNPNGLLNGLRDLAFYVMALEATYPNATIAPLTDPIPPVLMPDPVALSSGCPAQLLFVGLMAPGLYGYFCQPSFATLRGTCPCRRQPPPPPVPVPQQQQAKAHQPSTAEKAATAAAATAGTVGAGYLIYRGVRMIPSLFPPLWGTIPANAAIP